MAAADFCTVTPDVAAERAVASMVIAADSSLAAGSSPRRLVLDIPVKPSGSVTIHTHRTRCRSPQVDARTVGASQGLGPPSPISAAFTVGCVPVGFAVMCQLASHPSALYAV